MAAEIRRKPEAERFWMVMIFTKSSTLKPPRKRACPAVGRTWFGPEA